MPGSPAHLTGLLRGKISWRTGLILPSNGRNILNKKYLGEAYIALDGVYLNRQLHIWKGIGNRLEDVTYEDPYGLSPRLKFDYSSPGRGDRYYYTARVPIPLGQEEIAHKIMADIAAAHLSK